MLLASVTMASLRAISEPAQMVEVPFGKWRVSGSSAAPPDRIKVSMSKKLKPKLSRPAPYMADSSAYSPVGESRIASEPVEDTDTSSLMSSMSLKSTYPVQVTEPQDTVTLQFPSITPACIMTPTSRIQQPVENDGSECICHSSISSDFTKDPEYLNRSCEKCCCPAPPPMISDLMNDSDLLQRLQQKLDPAHCTVKNWKNFASRWGMSYDELTLLEHRTQGSVQHSPTQEFLLRNNQKSVRELTELCRLYQRIDVLHLLQRWMENDWPSRWQHAH